MPEYNSYLPQSSIWNPGGYPSPGLTPRGRSQAGHRPPIAQAPIAHRRIGPTEYRILTTEDPNTDWRPGGHDFTTSLAMPFWRCRSSWLVLPLSNPVAPERQGGSHGTLWDLYFRSGGRCVFRRMRRASAIRFLAGTQRRPEGRERPRRLVGERGACERGIFGLFSGPSDHVSPDGFFAPRAAIATRSGRWRAQIEA